MWFLLVLDMETVKTENSHCIIYFSSILGCLFVFFFQQSHEQLLLQVCDKICDLVCSVSTAALMNLGEDVYGRLQTLLAAR